MELSLIQRPISTTTKIIFPFHIKPRGLSYKFDSSFYKSHMTNRKIPEEEVENFFAELYMAVNHFGSLKLWEGSTEKLMFRYILGIYIIVGSLLIDTDKESLFDTILVWICCCSGLILLVNSLVFLLVVIRQKTKAEQKLLIKLQQVIDKYNTGIPSGISWRLSPENFQWIELELRHKQNQDEYLSERAVLSFEFDTSECRYHLFDSNHKHKKYNSEMTDHRLSKSDLDSFLNTINAITQKHNYGAPNQIMFFTGICLIIEVLIFFLFRKGGFGRLLFVIVLVSLFVSKYLFQRANEKEYLLSKVVKEEINEVLVNKTQLFSSKGLRWHMSGDDFTVLDLWLDYKYFNSFSNKHDQSETDIDVQINIDPSQMLLADHS